MPVLEKKDWPKTADGTTDWEALFEDKDQGFMAVVSASENLEQLRTRTEAITRLIFNRERDEAKVQKVMTLVNKVAPQGAGEERLPTMKAGIRQILGKVKEHRIKKAAAYAKKKKKQKTRSKNKIERRGNVVSGLLAGIAAVVTYPFSLLSSKGDKNAVAGNGMSDEKNTDNADQGDDEDSYFQQEAYVDHGGDGNTEWQDNDLYAVKEKPAEEGAFEDLVKTEEDNKYESWDDY